MISRGGPKGQRVERVPTTYYIGYMLISYNAGSGKRHKTATKQGWSIHLDPLYRSDMASASRATEQPTPSTSDVDMTPIQTKLVLLGEAAVGKTSVVYRFVQDDFQENREPTIGAAFLTQRCRLEDRLIKFEIWDTAGQERFHSLAPMYYRNAQASAVVYEVTKAASFEKAKNWVKELQRQAHPNIVIALVGNKLDLVSDNMNLNEEEASAQKAESDEDNEEAAPAVRREVPCSEAQQYADEMGLLFFETSAKTGENVLETFTEIAKHIPLETKPKSNQTTPSASNARTELVDLQRRANASGREGCSC